MNRLLFLLVLTGCATHTEVATYFTVTPTKTSDCAWVVRTNSVYQTTSIELLDAQGQSYLYYCCPTEQGADPLCLNPRWAKPSNDRPPLPSLKELEAEARKK